ncbi:hypothetical protein HDV00_007152 [Rhizophlyctis rosea]|nr:hypothetical protein HDV00_007152 [Rhizophlyctis rosea]
MNLPHRQFGLVELQQAIALVGYLSAFPSFLLRKIREVWRPIKALLTSENVDKRIAQFRICLFVAVIVAFAILQFSVSKEIDDFCKLILKRSLIALLGVFPIYRFASELAQARFPARRTLIYINVAAIMTIIAAMIASSILAYFDHPEFAVPLGQAAADAAKILVKKLKAPPPLPALRNLRLNVEIQNAISELTRLAETDHFNNELRSGQPAAWVAPLKMLMNNVNAELEEADVAVVRAYPIPRVIRR